MVKITCVGHPRPVAMIEQANGQTVPPSVISEIENGNVSPAGDGAASLLLRWTWENTASTSGPAGRWNGWQAAAWIATHDTSIVEKLGSRLEVRSATGERCVHDRNIEHCLRWEIARSHCVCGLADRGCVCLDNALGTLNRALKAGEIFEIGRQFDGRVTKDNARQMLFSGGDVQKLFPEAAAHPNSISDDEIEDWIRKSGHTNSSDAWAVFHAVPRFVSVNRDEHFIKIWKKIYPRGRGRPKVISK